MKSLSLKELWVQDAIEQKRFKLQKVGRDSIQLGRSRNESSGRQSHFETAEAATPEERSSNCIGADLCDRSRSR